MIEIILEDIPYEQDIRELFMAFYPGQEYSHTACDNALVSLYGYKADNRYIFNLTYRESEYSKDDFSVEIKNSRFDTKNELKRKLYKVLSKHTNKKLPWGTLTGIRPTKIIMQELCEGEAIAAAEAYMKETYLASDEKVKLCLQTAQKEKDILDKIDYADGWSLYIGIPFCPTRCLYCSFTSYPIELWIDKKERYIDALCKELTSVAKMMKGRAPQTIYMGGGTPTSLEAGDLDRILEHIEKLWDSKDILEFTVEAGRPDSITKSKLNILKKHNINRISINPQSMNQKTLNIIGRKHSVLDVINAYNMARELGFDNINMDIIAGLPEEGIDDLNHTMDMLGELSPDSITVHSLAIKRAARLNTQKEDYANLKRELTSDMLDKVQRRCEDMGLKPYYLYRQKNMEGNLENVGYSREGLECIYNILIMEERQTIVACGAGGTSKVVYPAENRIERIENVKDPDIYIERIDEMIARKEKMLAKY